ncbi:MAG: hypothetical protein J7497_17795 [Chitinophagaceae bacterium]|nr:hypothetical protein [Chitinophagaceae bacterium]
MTESVKKAVEELVKKAKSGEGNKHEWPRRSRKRSSLHQIIRKPEQAKRFMKMLNDAFRPED